MINIPLYFLELNISTINVRVYKNRFKGDKPN